MKILVIGCTGILGSRLLSFLQHTENDVFGTYHEHPRVDHPSLYQVDITQEASVEQTIKTLQPEVVIQTAAYTDVDGCEKNQQKAYAVNVLGTRHVVTSCQRHAAKLVYVSTDYVFNGTQGCYREDDAVDPVGYYGKTKLLGENEVHTLPDYIIARTAVLYGAHQKDFVNWVLNKLSTDSTVNIVTDQIISPTLNVDLSEQLLALVTSNETGIFHTAGNECISRYEFALRIAEAFDLNADLIHPVEMKDLNWVAPRPKNSSLNVSKISRLKKPYDVNESLHIFQEETRQKS